MNGELTELLREIKHFLDTKHKENRKDIRQILKLLNGNGKIGLCAKVSILWGVSIFLSITIVGLIVRIVSIKL